MSEPYISLVSLLKPRELVLENKNDAKVFRDEQVGRWQQLLGSLERRITGGPNDTWHLSVTQAVGAMTALVKAKGENWFSVTPIAGQSIKVVGSIRLLPEEMGPITSIALNNPIQTASALFQETGSAFFAAAFDQNLASDTFNVFSQ